MKINKMDHICVAVKDLDKAREVWEPLLGKTKPDDAYIDEPEKSEWHVTGSGIPDLNSWNLPHRMEKLLNS